MLSDPTTGFPDLVTDAPRPGDQPGRRRLPTCWTRHPRRRTTFTELPECYPCSRTDLLPMYPDRTPVTPRNSLPARNLEGRLFGIPCRQGTSKVAYSEFLAGKEFRRRRPLQFLAGKEQQRRVAPNAPCRQGIRRGSPPNAPCRQGNWKVSPSQLLARKETRVGHSLNSLPARNCSGAADYESRTHSPSTPCRQEN